MGKIRLEDWPFSEGKTATVYWITSPQTNRETGARFCDAYFQQKSGEMPKSVPVPWGLMPELWIGRSFCNGVPQQQAGGPLIKIQANRIEGCRFKSAADAFPTFLYSLFSIGALCRESCAVFSYDGTQYAIPCIELARALYMRNSLLANQLLSSGGLEDCIALSSWEVTEDDLDFDLTPLCRGSLNADFVKIIASLYGTEQLRNGWKETYVRYKRNQMIQTEIPPVSGLVLHCRQIVGRDLTFLPSVVKVTLPMPFRNITYGPAADRIRKDDDGIGGGEADCEERERFLRESIRIGSAAETAKSGGDVTNRSFGCLDPVFSGPKVCVHHRTKTKTVGTAGGGRPGTTVQTCREEENPEEIFTPNERTGRGTLPEVRLIPEKMQRVESHVDFSDFCRALEQFSMYTDVKLEDVQFYRLPGEKPVCFLPDGGRRNYAVARVSAGSQMWTILELCVKDGYSVSTLLVQGADERNELAHRMMSKLVEENGHWTQSCFSRGMVYRTLDHYRGRRPERWAALLYSKMY